jgi:hypothetical protein
MSEPIGPTPGQNQFTRAVADEGRGSLNADPVSTHGIGLGTARALFNPTEK